MRKFLKSWVINTAAVLVAVYIVPGIRFTGNSLLTPIVTALLLGIINAFIRPILMLMALPLLISTLGLFMLVINALVLYFVSFLMGENFQVDGFGSAFVGALIISVISLLLNLLTGGSRARVQVTRHQRRDSGHGGNGPVIDV
jgi:putative membrane protein